MSTKPAAEEIKFEPIQMTKLDPAAVLQRIDQMLADFHARTNEVNLPVIA